MIVLRGRKLAGFLLHLGPAHRRARPCCRLYPRPDVGIMVQPGDDHLVTREPVPCEGVRQPVGQRGHVRAKDHSVRVSAGEVGHRAAAPGGDLVRAVARRECPARVANPGAVGVRDHTDDRFRHLGTRGTVEVGVSVGERGVIRPDLAHIECHARQLPFGCAVAGMRRRAGPGRGPGKRTLEKRIPREHNPPGSSRR